MVRSSSAEVLAGSAADGRGECEMIQAAIYGHLQRLHAVSVRVRFARGEIVFSEEDLVDRAYTVISGAVRICRYTQDGRRQIPEFLLPGDVFGIMDMTHRGFTAEAASSVVLRAYPRDRLDQLFLQDPEAGNQRFALLKEHVMTMHRHLLVLGCQNARERLASFFVSVAQRTNALNCGMIELPMSRYDIADHLGLTMETVCRAFTELKRDRLIATPNLRQILLLDYRGLERLANGVGTAGSPG